tara:strand:+ start:1529 stop:2302 length:774 start_codon:yes stop_codon:yes gene_type:complete
MIIKFVFLTFVYFVLRKIITDKFGVRNQINMLKWIFLGIYLFVTIGLQIADTTKLMKKMCGRVEFNKVMMYTFIPNVLIFGSIIAILATMPGWKAPFANTLGYVCAWAGGCKKDFDTLLSSDINSDLMVKIIQDKSMIINEITPNTFDLFISQMSDNNLLSVPYKKLIEFENLQNKGEKLDEKQQDYLDAFISLYNNVVLKDLVSEGLWYLLAGGLVITMTQNAISEMECEKNTEEMKQEYEEGGGWKKSKMENIKE